MIAGMEEDAIFWIGVATLVVLLLVGAGLAYYRHYLVKLLRATEAQHAPPPDNTEVVLDAIDGVRDQVDSHSQHTALEHENLGKKVDTISGRTQWMVANVVAEHEAEVRAIAAAKLKAAAEKDAGSE